MLWRNRETLESGSTALKVSDDILFGFIYFGQKTFFFFFSKRLAVLVVQGFCINHTQLIKCLSSFEDPDHSKLLRQLLTR